MGNPKRISRREFAKPTRSPGRCGCNRAAISSPLSIAWESSYDLAVQHHGSRERIDLRIAIESDDPHTSVGKQHRRGRTDRAQSNDRNVIGFH